MHSLFGRKDVVGYLPKFASTLFSAYMITLYYIIYVLSPASCMQFSAGMQKSAPVVKTGSLARGDVPGLGKVRLGV